MATSKSKDKKATQAASEQQTSDQPEMTSIGVPLPVMIFDRVKVDELLSKKPVAAKVAEWIDESIDPDGPAIDINNVMNAAPAREKVEPGVTLKSLTVQLTKRHAAMLRMEALRRATSVRALLREAILANIRPWQVVPLDEAM
jgi:hypothetical protein